MRGDVVVPAEFVPGDDVGHGVGGLGGGEEGRHPAQVPGRVAGPGDRRGGVLRPDPSEGGGPAVGEGARLGLPRPVGLVPQLVGLDVGGTGGLHGGDLRVDGAEPVAPAHPLVGEVGVPVGHPDHDGGADRLGRRGHHQGVARRGALPVGELVAAGRHLDEGLGVERSDQAVGRRGGVGKPVETSGGEVGDRTEGLVRVHDQGVGRGGRVRGYSGEGGGDGGQGGRAERGDRSAQGPCAGGLVAHR